MRDRGLKTTVAEIVGAPRDFGRWRWLADEGFVVSICYGVLHGAKSPSWSVDAIDDVTGNSFKKPFAASSFAHAIEIALSECPKLREDPQT